MPRWTASAPFALAQPSVGDSCSEVARVEAGGVYWRGGNRVSMVSSGRPRTGLAPVVPGVGPTSPFYLPVLPTNLSLNLVSKQVLG
jgi:hypothetical protein